MNHNPNAVLSVGEASSRAGIQIWALPFNKNMGQLAQRRGMKATRSLESYGLFKLQ